MAKFYVISSQRNANKHAVTCIDSVNAQTYRPLKHIFIDDVSSDDTVSIVENHISKSSIDRVDIIKNENRKYRLKNIIDAIDSIPPEDNDAIVCLLDGDDWLSTDKAIESLNSVYESHPHLEYVYTNWMYSHNGELGISKQIPDSNWNPYRDPWITSAMATFRVSTFKSIPRANFLDASGIYFKMGTDHAYVLPMLHILREKHGNYSAVGFFNYPLYVYQFVENEMRRRVDSEGVWERTEAHVSAMFIRQRGFVK
jgi:glycosyltransferase involved in cell wall biosynthesis